MAACPESSRDPRLSFESLDNGKVSPSPVTSSLGISRDVNGKTVHGSDRQELVAVWFRALRVVKKVVATVVDIHNLEQKTCPGDISPVSS
ncbi:hypothetical protein HGM15179_009406 [Zosterops borbonicus]|uniref:Uncharacterized protein n=1 Tax=Zosterops borbonicus TaxID=364589 RepID=A0A8K1LL76_9PASS|nr:hypothetical protein HGM15179_009406 [Zosterops borbonicus]